MRRMPLLLKDKKISAAPVSEDSQKKEVETKTVEIRGLTGENDSEMELCRYYFENPKKGGGPFEKEPEWDCKEKIMLITFQEASGKCLTVFQFIIDCYLCTN